MTFKDNVLLAYQLAFDLNENAPQEFLLQLRQCMDPPREETNNEEGKDGSNSKDEPKEASSGPSTAVDTETSSGPSTAVDADDDAPAAEDQEKAEQKEALMRILSGEESIKHHMQFLIKNNHTDMLILRQLKDASRGSCTNNAVVMANGLMHNGTTCDDFLRFDMLF